MTQSFFFFFNDTATTEIYTLSLHDALPISSTPPSRAAPHDSGPMWVATPLSCDFFIHYNLAGLTGAQEQYPCERTRRRQFCLPTSRPSENARPAKLLKTPLTFAEIGRAHV